MKQISLFIASIAFIIGSAFTNPEPTQTHSINLEKSVIGWTGYKVTGQHQGILKLQSGDLEFADGMLSGGTFTIDMASLKNTDLAEGMAGKLEGHLMSPDFFDVENHPTANFEITKVVSRGTEGDYKVIGNLTIKGKTEEIKFNTSVKMEEEGGVANADVTIDRTDFDVKYGSGTFFDGLKDKTIYDEFDLNISLVLD